VSYVITGNANWRQRPASTVGTAFTLTRHAQRRHQTKHLCEAGDCIARSISRTSVRPDAQSLRELLKQRHVLLDAALRVAVRVNAVPTVLAGRWPQLALPVMT